MPNDNARRGRTGRAHLFTQADLHANIGHAAAKVKSLYHLSTKRGARQLNKPSYCLQHIIFAGLPREHFFMGAKMRAFYKCIVAVSIGFWPALGITTPGLAGCTVYLDENLTGDRVDVAHNEIDLTLKKRLVVGDWNDEISSIQVHSGICRVFEHTEFHGAYRDLKKGIYKNGTEIGLPDNTISSIEVR